MDYDHTERQDPSTIKVAPRVNLSLSNVYHTVMLLTAVVGIIAGGLAAFYSLQVKLTDHEVRLRAIEAQIEDQHRADASFQTEMRAALAQANQTLADLRVALAGKGFTK